MSFFSTLRLALHTLMQNKVRSILTVIIITVVSFVIVFLFSFAFSFQSSMSENINKLVNEDGLTITVSAMYTMDSGGGYGGVNMALEDVEKIVDIFDDGTGNISYISMRSNTSMSYEGTGGSATVSMTPFYSKSNPFVGQSDYLVSGRLWNTSDEGTSNIFINVALAKLTGAAIGDSLPLIRYNHSGSSYTTESYTVCGVISGKQNDDYYGNSTYTAYLDYKNFSDAPVYNNYSGGYYGSDGMCINKVTGGMIPQEGEIYGTGFQSYMSGIGKKIEDMKYSHPNVSGYYSAYLLSLMSILNIVFWIILALILFISIIIILLSINSVSNTVRISAEQNRKFFGVMKAIGMKNKTLRAILITQVIIMLIIGVGIATGIAFFAVGGLEFVLASLIGSIFYATGEAIILCSVSPIVPVITFVLLAGFVMLFTRASLSEVSRMDVITVINEVS